MKLLIARIIVGITICSSVLMVGAILWVYWLPIIAITAAALIVFGVPVSVIWAYDTIDKNKRERGNQLWIQTKKN